MNNKKYLFILSTQKRMNIKIKFSKDTVVRYFIRSLSNLESEIMPKIISDFAYKK